MNLNKILNILVLKQNCNFNTIIKIKTKHQLVYIYMHNDTVSKDVILLIH